MITNRKPGSIDSLRPQGEENPQDAGAVSRPHPTNESGFGVAAGFGSLPPRGIAPDSYRASGGNEACEMVTTNLSAYLDGELDADQTALVESHLDRCAGCTEVFAAIQANDSVLEREWREQASLPSSLERKQALDAILDALPPAPVTPTPFSSKRVHSKTRWMRLSSGVTGVLVLFTLLWSSYQLGYRHGRANQAIASSPRSESELSSTAVRVSPASYLSPPDVPPARSARPSPP